MMAKKKPSNTAISKKSVDLGAGVRDLMDKLYSNTYMTTPKLGNDLTSITSDIDASLDKITNANLSAVGMPNISKLYSRAGVVDAQSDNSVVNGIENTFNDNMLMDSVLSSYMQNKYLKDLDDEIDTVCKYMPRLTEALETRKDNVLSADHFSKDFLTIKNKQIQYNNETFTDQINQLKDKYNLAEFVEDIYSNASKYGERFIYVVPYHKALNKLLNTKSQTRIATLHTEGGKIITEDCSLGQIDAIPFPADLKIDQSKLAGLHVSVELSQSNVIESAIDEMSMAKKKLKVVNESALNYFSEASKEKNNSKTIKFDSTLDNTLNVDGINDDDIPGSDGLIDPSKQQKKDPINDKFPGCVVKILDRCKVIPIYIEDMCLGYYYIEFKDSESDMINYTDQINNPMGSVQTDLNKSILDMDDNLKQDNMLKYISSQISQFIDAKFINNNQDLRKEIYMILKHNDIYNNPNGAAFKVTFIPPEDMVHVAFTKDEKTHRGISDLSKSLIPAKLYSCLYITNTLMILTRGSDKRVYYVKNQVDTNISKVLLNTINQIKKSNFGIRQIENINNILNITGRFNDYVIPLSPAGDAPVQFEVMQGQTVDVKTDLMNMLEEMAINSTDVPLELIQARQSIDYAVQLTMTNSKFLRKVYNRQAKYQVILSSLVTKLFNAEYNTTYDLEVTLPPPMFLNIANTNQLIINTKEYVDSIVDFETTNIEDDTLAIAYFKRDLMEYYLGSHINLSAHNEIFERAKIKAEKDRKVDTEESSNGT